MRSSFGCSLFELFFELLQVAIGNRSSLSVIPSSQQWEKLYEMAQKQSLAAIAFRGVSILKEQNPEDGWFGSSIGIPEAVYLQWMGMMVKTIQRNREITAACASLTQRYAHDGLSACILKGQGNLPGYGVGGMDNGMEKDAVPLGMYRTPGDIDVWCAPSDPCGLEIAVSDFDGKGAHYSTFSGQRAVIEYALMQHRLAGTKPNNGVRYHHVDMPAMALSSGSGTSVSVEFHFRPSFMCSPLRNARLQNWCKENLQFGLNDAKIDDCVIPVPTTSFNAVYQLVHIYRHLFDEGVGLRQLLDYYFVLRALHIEQGDFVDRTKSLAQWAEGMGIAVKSNVEIMHTLSLFGMKRFAGAVMYVLQTVFAMPDAYLLCPANEKEGRFLLDEIMQAGNFGKYDDRIKHGGSQFSHAIEKTKHNLRLLTHYPEEVMWEPVFRVYHWVWRRFELWRF